MFANPHLSLLLLATFAYPSLHAQTTQADIETRLRGAPLYLRGFYADDKLKFDANGPLVSRSSLTSFTLDGVDVRTVHLQADRLTLDGVRVGLKLAENVPTRVVAQIGSPFGGTHDEPIHIEIQTPVGNDFTHALDTIFTPTLADLVPQLPLEWQSFAHEHLLNEPAPPMAGSTSSPKIGGEVKAPVVISAPEPKFSSAAHAAQLSGAVLIYLQVNTAGMPTHVRILRPVGLGLDEQAVLAVDRYKFKPALQNGTPVPVEMNVEVNFQLF